MSNENRKLLADALRSGEYKQGKGCLNNTEVGLCCLGVSCEVYQKIKGDLVLEERNGKVGYDGQFGYAPRKVQEFFDFDYQGGFVKYVLKSELVPGTEAIDDLNIRSLVTCNDSAGLTFEQIASIIESGDLLEGAGEVDRAPRSCEYIPDQQPVETPVAV